MAAHLDFPTSNGKYAEMFDKGELALLPTKKYIVVTCMDAHVDIKLGDAHIICNASGSVKEALRSIVISQRLLGTHEVAVFHHTGCGMLLFSTDHLCTLVKDAEPENLTIGEAVNKIDFLEFGDLEESVKRDVKFLQENPLLLKETKVSGWIYDVATGRIKQVV
ncbi:hypothetical protein H0H81_006608 [Sphagnurus paluster]|uniref:Carbonic anhydrase n=1 Tax=Sphagnurus paluster TaxID=117069 RepID=A0A9P7K6I8_9AGAR|nr:hypothetical protein H0H81_006608 [Sphagnurus paluster]